MVLVTGGTGLVGSHLLYQLSLENENIVAIRRKSSDLAAVKHVFSYYTKDYEALFNKITWKTADINDISSLDKAFDKITHVYHCAALVSFNPKDYRLLRKINIEGTANMINLSITNKVQKFCFVSSIASVGKSIRGKPITEENEWNADEKHHGYAISKYGAEVEVWRGSQEGLAIVIVNPGVILGAGFFKTGSGKLFDSVYKGFKYYTEGVTGFVSVEDVVSSMIALMKSTIKNERYILVAENLSFKDVLQQIAIGFNVKKPSIKISKLLSEFGWRLAWLKSTFTGSAPIITKHSARSAHDKRCFSSKKLEKAIGFKYESISTSIKKICALYKQNH